MPSKMYNKKKFFIEKWETSVKNRFFYSKKKKKKSIQIH